MSTGDVPLVVFTILAQMSVGAFLTLGALRFVLGRKGRESYFDQIADPVLYLIGPAMVVALAVSLAHLGSPLHALYTCENFGRSWLSREIVFGVAFCVMTIAFSVIHKTHWLGTAFHQLAGAVTALFGIAFIFVQGMIYVLPTIPAWDSWATPMRFFIAAFLLGSLGVGAGLLVVSSIPRFAAHHSGPDSEDLIRRSLRLVLATAMVFLGIEFVAEPTYAFQLSGQGGAAAQGAKMWLYGNTSMFVIEMTFIFVGAGLIGYFLHLLNSGGPGQPVALSAGEPGTGAGNVLTRERVMTLPARHRVITSLATQRAMTSAIMAAFILVLTAEVLSRLLFYAANIRIGFGGF